MAYQINRASGGDFVKAFSIPPSIDPAIAKTPLADLSHAFTQVWDGRAAKRYAEALAGASAEAIERARPQIYFTIDNLRQRVSDESYAVLRDARNPKSAEGLIGEILAGVAVDAERLLQECDRAPRNKLRLKEFAGALSYLAEIQVVCAAAARELDADAFGRLADAADKTFARLSAEAETFRRQTETRYPEVAGTLPQTAEIRAAAKAALEAFDFSIAPLAGPQIRRLLLDVGDHGDLWKISRGEALREKMIEAGRHHVLTGKEAASIAARAGAAIEQFDAVYNRAGFLAEMRKIAVSFRHQALEQADWALEYDEAHIRREGRRPYRGHDQAEHEARIAKELAELPERRLSNQRHAAELHGAYAMMSGFLHRLGRSLGRAPDDAFVSFRKENGALVGEPDVPESDLIVIYDDHIVRAEGRHPEAVYAIRMPRAAVADGVPPLEAVRARMFDRATNYHTLVECLTELDGETERKFFFGGVKISGHDGFEVMERGVSLQEAPEAGPRM